MRMMIWWKWLAQEVNVITAAKQNIPENVLISNIFVIVSTFSSNVPYLYSVLLIITSAKKQCLKYPIHVVCFLWQFILGTKYTYTYINTHRFLNGQKLEVANLIETTTFASVLKEDIDHKMHQIFLFINIFDLSSK